MHVDPRSGDPNLRTGQHDAGEGAAHTRGSDDAQTQWVATYDSEREALVGELVALLEAQREDGECVYRGGPCPAPNQATWDRDQEALWSALWSVTTSRDDAGELVGWPTDYPDRLAILEGIMHVTPGNLLRLYLYDLCFQELITHSGGARAITSGI